MSMTVRLELFVKEIDRSVDFYTAVLGFEVVKINQEKSHVSLKNGAVQLNLGLVEKLSDKHYFRPEIEKNRKGTGVEIVLDVDDIQEIYKEVRNSEYPVFEELTKRSWGLTDFRMVDPDGYYLRFTSRLKVEG